MELPSVRQKLIDHKHHEWIHRTEYVAGLFEKHILKDSNIIQLGCACGYVLDALWEMGYRNLTGLDKNPVWSDWNPEIKFIHSELEKVIDKLDSYDVVLCTQFLYTFPPNKEWLFEKIAKKVKKYLVVVEKEEENTSVHWGRNYKDIFEAFDLKQIFEEIKVFPLQFGNLTTTTTRIFKNGSNKV